MEEKQIKLTDEELKSLQKLKTDNEQLLVAFGDLKIAKLRIQQQWNKLEEAEKQLELEYVALGEQEQHLTKQITGQYGDGSLNIETGEFKPVK
jgi:hypothetical protein